MQKFVKGALTWTPNVCTTTAMLAGFGGFGTWFDILLGPSPGTDAGVLHFILKRTQLSQHTLGSDAEGCKLSCGAIQLCRYRKHALLTPTTDRSFMNTYAVQHADVWTRGQLWYAWVHCESSWCYTLSLYTQLITVASFDPTVATIQAMLESIFVFVPEGSSSPA